MVKGEDWGFEKVTEMHDQNEQVPEVPLTILLAAGKLDEELRLWLLRLLGSTVSVSEEGVTGQLNMIEKVRAFMYVLIAAFPCMICGSESLDQQLASQRLLGSAKGKPVLMLKLILHKKPNRPKSAKDKPIVSHAPQHSCVKRAQFCICTLPPCHVLTCRCTAVLPPYTTTSTLSNQPLEFGILRQKLVVLLL